MVRKISDVKFSIRRTGQRNWRQEPSLRTGTIHAAGLPESPRNRAYKTRGRDFTDRMVAAVRDIQVAVRIDRHPMDGLEPRGGSVAVHRPGSIPAPSQRCYQSFRRDFADCKRAPLAYVQISRTINHNSFGRIEARNRSEPIGVPSRAAQSREGCHHPLGSYLANHMRPAIRDKQISESINCESIRIHEARTAPDCIHNL